MKLALAVVVALFFSVNSATPALAAPDAVSAPSPAAKASLPQDEPYQKTLRAYMATLKEADFQPENKDLTVVPVEDDADAKLRTWVLSLGPPAVGRKRNHSSVMIKAGLFTLESIEGAEVMRPPAHPEPLVDLANWKYAGNPYFDSRPLRLRAFVLQAIDMMMLDRLFATADEKTLLTQDQLASNIASFAYVYPGFRDVVPGEVRDACRAGLRRLVLRQLAQGPTVLHGRTQGMQTVQVAALAVACPVLDDAKITREAESYAKRMFTEPVFFSPAGYFPQGGTLDSFNGLSASYALWAGLASDWDFARDGLARFYRLKAHLTLPEPDAAGLNGPGSASTWTGPSHFSSLTPPDPFHDQWITASRWTSAAALTDEAACFVKWPTEEEIAAAAGAAVMEVNAQLHELSWAPHGLEPAPWKFAMASPFVNAGSQYFRKGLDARRKKLMGTGKESSMALLPVLRPGDYVRAFGDEFLAAKTGDHAAILHFGVIAEEGDPESGVGLGGGALSAFWTKSAGSVILSRGVGAWSPRYAKMFDEWRTIPTHAVAGVTAEGKAFTSARIVRPEHTLKADDKSYTLEVHAPIPPERRGVGTLLAGKLDYSRKFESTPKGLRVTTTIAGDGKDTIAELYEVLPVYHRDAETERTAAPTTIEFKAGDAWVPATTAYTEKVAAIRLTRFGGSVEITFDAPRRAKLAPADWVETYMTHNVNRNILIDLLESDDKPTTVTAAKSVSYRIEAVQP
ncbi:MAG: hypothetical protein NTW19_02785 [Planctomycetota bacterium]|nr:hypothetical protein [Planctomycetota bacterium]